MDNLQWIEEESKVNQIEDFTLIPERMLSIQVHYIYINVNLEVEDRVIQVVDLDISGNESILSKERILYLIQNHKMYTPTTQYKFMSGLLYHIDILAAHLQSFIKEDTGKLMSHPFLKECFIVNDIIIKPSLPIFHSINAVYFFFKEEILKRATIKNTMVSKTAKVKPSLEKEEEEKGPQKRITKRVRIQEDAIVTDKWNTSKKKRI